MAPESPRVNERPREILVFPGARTGGVAPVAQLRLDRVPTGGDSAWDELCERLLDRWPVLTAEELEATHGQPALVDALIEAKLRYGRRLADETFRPWRLHVTQPPRSGARTLLGVLGLMSASGLAFFGLLHP